MKNHYAVYGLTKLRREFCPRCKSYALVVDNLLQCCDRKVGGASYHDTKRMSIADAKRRIPSPVQQAEILKRQENKCIYCGNEFGSLVYRKKSNKIIPLKLHFDHLVPYSYSYNSKKVNFVAACHICNGIKSNKMFNTIEEVKDYVAYNRQKKGYQLFTEVEVPDVQ